LKVPVNRPLITSSDRESVIDALDRGEISGTAPLVDELENELTEFFLGSHASLVSSGTSACDLAVIASGISSGHKVLVSASTIMSTVSQIARAGASIDTLDVDPLTWNVDFNNYIGMDFSNYKAVVPVHLYGLQSNISVIQADLEELGVDIIEDAAEAFSQKDSGEYCGTRGRFGIFSFYANKLITSGEGGLILSKNPEDHKRIQSLKNLSFGKSERLLNEDISWNLRMPALSAALLRSQLKNIQKTLADKQLMASRYIEGLHGIEQIQLPSPGSFGSSNHYWVFGLVLREDSQFTAETLANLLKVRGIETRRFFPPLRLQPTLKNVVSNSPTPVADNLWKKGIYLPFGSGIQEREVDYVIEILKEILN
jgi:perosamine synthetase